jgi:hypothetical protein
MADRRSLHRVQARLEWTVRLHAGRVVLIEAGRHLAFGYMDQPPLTPLLDRTASIFGVSPTAIRIIPALAGGAVVLAAARFAELSGAGRFGRVLAALLMACSPVLISSDHVGNATPAESPRVRETEGFSAGTQVPGACGMGCEHLGWGEPGRAA